MVHFAPLATRLPDRLHADAGDVHLWAWGVDHAPARVASFAALLAPDELDRANRFTDGRDRSRFVVARGMMREVLARYCGRRPEALRFAYGAYGKPAVIGSGPHFSLSRRGGRAVIAISTREAVGVDIEFFAPSPDATAIMLNNASKAEIDAYTRLPASERGQAFFCWWTRKEAVVKGVGGGLSIPLRSFDVPIDAELNEAQGAIVHGLGGTWALRHFRLHDQYYGALASEGAIRTVKAWFIGPDFPTSPGAVARVRP